MKLNKINTKMKDFYQEHKAAIKMICTAAGGIALGIGMDVLRSELFNTIPKGSKIVTNICTPDDDHDHVNILFASCNRIGNAVPALYIEWKNKDALEIGNALVNAATKNLEPLQ